MIELEEISQHFRGADGHDVHALYDVDLTINRGEIFGIIGRNDTGKSTLVRIINLLNRPTSGVVAVAEQELTALNADGLRQARRKIGMIFQHSNLLSSRTVYDNVTLSLKLAGTSRECIREIVLPLLELVGLSTHKDHYPAQIPGGQKQHVGTAYALASQSDALLPDEATSALDPETARSTPDLLRKISDELGLTIMLTIYQMEVIKQVCDRAAVLDAGRVVELGRVIDVFLKPEHGVIRALIGEVILQELPPSILARVESRLTACEQGGHDHLFRLAFTGVGVDQPVLAQAIRDCGLDFSILHGHIDKIQGQAFGSLAILASDKAADINNAMNFLREQGMVVGEVGHVV